MTKKASLTAPFYLALLLALLSVPTIYVVSANPIPTQLPSITIRSDGTIDPANATIEKAGNVYTLTASIHGYSLEIKRSNIIIDGASMTLYGGERLNANAGITIEANNATVKNLNINQYYLGVDIQGSNNTITKTSILSQSMGQGGINIKGQFNVISENNIAGGASGVELLGDYNNLTGNTIDKPLDIRSNFNNITQNTLNRGFWYFSGSNNNITGNEISEGLSFVEPAKLNYVVGNTIRDKGIGLDKEPNTFYLNNFINLAYDVAPKNVNDSAVLYSMNVFDNSSIGNYWNNYNGTDSDHDGIGDTPYVITGYTMQGNLTDRYPLIAPFNYSTLTPSFPSQSPSPSPTTSPTPSPSPTPTTSTTLPPESSASSASEQPTQSQETNSTAFPVEYIAIAGITAIAIIVGIAFILKRKHR